MPTSRPHRRPPSRGGQRFLRGLSGICAGGLVVLALSLVVARVFAGPTSLPGPAGSTLLGHGSFAAAAVVAQAVADRDDTPRGTAAAAGVLGMVFVVLWIWWWR